MIPDMVHLFIISFTFMFVVYPLKVLSQYQTQVSDIGSPQDYEVVFISAVFRHGDRTPEHLYPNDPNKEEDFHPIGLGGLTLEGKARAFLLGTELRYLYRDLLGETYIPYMVHARSTDVDRTKMSLMLVLSALYPPRDKQIWNPILNWQPIPYNYVPITQDFLAPITSCPLYLDELKRIQNSEEITLQVEKYRPLMVNLSRWTGMTINSSTDMLLLYHTLMAEHSMGLKLPDWAYDIAPKGSLRDATILRLQILNYNNELRRLFSGVLLKNIIDIMDGIANGTIKDGRKIHLYSAHDTNIASLLMALDIFTPHVPEYSSCIIFELDRGLDNQFYVKIRYYLGIPPETKVLPIPECGMNPCPLKKFIDLVANMMPRNENTACPQ